MQLPGKIPFTLLVSIALLTSGCGGGSTSVGSTPTPTPTPSTANEWTWMSGSSTEGANGGQSGVYGTLGVASTSNVPGARSNSVSSTDASGDLWLFGGSGCSSACRPGGFLNDLWEFNPSTKEWTWVSGSNTLEALQYGLYGQPGVYGTKGVPSASNVPGSHSNAVSWIDSSGNFWLFGGSGYDSTGSVVGDLNDLWEFSPTTKEWTWVSGSDTRGASGVYGTLGVASASNVPGARDTFAGWIDSSGNLWLFGGEGVGGNLNDVWEFSPTTKEWTWVSGNNTGGAYGVYGTQGVAAASNVPGGRSFFISADKNGNFWLYGGAGNGAVGSSGNDLSDLWKFSTSTKEWTWVSGSNTGSVLPDYGTQGVASASNTPGGRDSGVSWVDSSGNFWLFGGFDDDGPNQYLNDLWEFNTATKEWTWVGGSNTGEAKGVYGTLGTASASNVPGARGSEGIPVAWKDSSGNFWLFGGEGYDSTGAYGPLNDLWRFQP